MTRRISAFFPIAILLAALLGSMFPIRPAYAAAITVAPGVVSVANDGQCSLIEAIENANADTQVSNTDCPAGSGADVIILASGAVYTITTADVMSPDSTPGGDGNSGLIFSGPVTLSGNGATIRRSPALTCTLGNGQTAAEFRILQGEDSTTINNVILENGCADRVSGALFGTLSGYGGGILNVGILNNVTVRNNQASRRGGGLALDSMGGTVVINDSVFENNTATGNNSFDGGGAIHTTKSLTIQNTTFRNNTYTGDSHGGGAILATGGTISVSDSVFEGNQGGGNGGGAIAISRDFFEPELIVTRATFRNNQTVGDYGNGGAISANGNLEVRSSTFDSNRANGNDTFGYGSGGGIAVINSDLVLENVTLSGNRANGNGGAVYYRADSSALLGNVTIASNIADANANGNGSGGGIYSTGDGTGNDLDLENSILAGNTGNAGPDCGGYINSGVGHNLIQTVGADCTLGGVTTGNIIGQNPLLAALANNGGPTPTRALLTGSPAIDAGAPGTSCATTDQRGVARFDGNYDGIVRCDMGAYEFNQPAANPAATTAPVLPNTGFAPGKVTRLVEQPANKAYTAYNDLTLELPTLKVSTTIVGVLKSDSGWDVSWLGNSAGWLEGSAFPTWSGNTVLTGHVWNADNTPGVFANLKNMRYGERFYIHAFGQTYVYEVRENRLLWGNNNTAAVFKSEKFDWVTLLTCEGYNPLSGNYFFRRMVRAVLVEVK